MPPSHPEPETTDLDLAIIGAGAAGLMAAIFAGRTAREIQPTPPLRIAALDGAARIGAKILVSGGGRCNVTHDVVFPQEFNGGNRRIIAMVLRSFDVPQTIAFFSQLGVELKREETGKLFPVTDQARTVLDALLRAAADAGAVIREGTRVTSIAHHDASFEIVAPTGTIRSRAVILATGGKSLPKTGSDGGGYELARGLGHTCTPTTPALSPLVLETGHWLATLSGISIDAELTVASATGRSLHRQRGSLLFTHFGISGPAAMDISRHWIAAHNADVGTTLTVNLTPDLDFSATERIWLDAIAANPRSTVQAVLGRRLPERLARAIAQEAAQVPSSTLLSHLTRDQRRALIHAVTALRLPVVRDRGYLFAEATAGGIPLTEIDPATLASRRCRGLFLCGEMLDADGRIGGYNFQWAWASGRTAGISAARYLTSC